MITFVKFESKYKTTLLLVYTISDLINSVYTRTYHPYGQTYPCGSSSVLKRKNGWPSIRTHLVLC